MKARITLDKPAREAIATLAKIARKQSIPILNCLRLEGFEHFVSIEANDLYHAVRVKLPAQVDGPGALCVDSATLAKIVRATKGKGATLPICETDNLHATIGTSEVPTMKYVDFPTFPTIEGDTVTLDGGLLATALRAVRSAASTDPTRPHLAGVNLAGTDHETIDVCATDGHRLAVTTLPGYVPAGCGAPVPGHALLHTAGVDALVSLLRDGPVTWTTRGVAHSFVQLHVCVWIRSSGEQFPPYAKVIPKINGAGTHVLAQADTLIAAFRTVAPCVTAKGGSARLGIAPGFPLRVTAENPDVGKASAQADVETTGDELPDVGFNLAYLAEALAGCKGQDVGLHFGGVLDPCTVITPHAKWVVMPMRI